MIAGPARARHPLAPPAGARTASRAGGRICIPEVVPDPNAEPPFDILILRALVVDGAGNPRYRADVGITENRIAVIEDLHGFDATRTINAAGRAVTPGFVDVTGQSSLVLITDPRSLDEEQKRVAFGRDWVMLDTDAARATPPRRRTPTPALPARSRVSSPSACARTE